MSKHIHRSRHEPIRDNPSFDERWNGPDNGLITCWEVGRKENIKFPELAKKAKNGELPILLWKGGINRKTQKKVKYGCLNYLAQWQGLRDEDLDIDMSEEIEIICSKTGMKVIFTADFNKYNL